MASASCLPTGVGSCTYESASAFSPGRHQHIAASSNVTENNFPTRDPGFINFGPSNVPSQGSNYDESLGIE
ncbi:MAG: hypothetical protein CMJ95_04640 [Planctomycetes bacterium]|nr:hypothetical protein [Planctomycetota bacterium]